MPTQKRHLKSATRFSCSVAVYLRIVHAFDLLFGAKLFCMDMQMDEKKHGGSMVASSNATDTISDAQANASQAIENVKIWFVKEQGGELQPAAVERTLITHDPIKEATDQLLRGPTPVEQEAGLRSENSSGHGHSGCGKERTNH